MDAEWLDDINRHIPIARGQRPYLRMSGLWLDERCDEATGEVICEPQPYALLEALPQLRELSLRYRFKVTIGDQVKEPYGVGDSYRAELAALVARFDLIKIATGNCELRLTPSNETFDVVRSEAIEALRHHFPELSPAQLEARWFDINAK